MLSEMKKYKNWVGYQLEMVAGSDKPKKIPYNPSTGGRAMANNPATWNTYAAAMSWATEQARKQGLQVGQNHGVGFEFSASPFAGIDLDNCIDSNGHLTDLASDIVKIMNSYTEYSPSEKGLHILFKIDGTEDEWRKFFNGKLGAKIGSVEFYTGVHFFTVTEKPYGELKPIENRTSECKEVYRKYMTQQQPVAEKSDRNIKSDLLEVMFNAKNGDAIRRLYSGDITGYYAEHKDGNIYPDHNSADLALCSHLAFYTGNNAAEIDRLFRASGLMREKWNENRGGKTYGEITIEKAIAGTSSTYEPGYNSQAVKQAKPDEKPIETHTLFTYLSNSFSGDIEKHKSFADLKTGFANLDKYVSLYPGLYVIGAVSSLGKTTFIHQMADNIARSGRYTLFFSLEQTEFELAAKGLARIIGYKDFCNILKSGKAEKDITFSDFNNAETAVRIKNGKARGDLVDMALSEYNTFSNREIIVELPFSATITDITDTIKAHADKRPVVFIDYLQIIKPQNDKKITTKEAIDLHVGALKKLSVELNITIFLISSFNRQNYLSVVDFESFKESGGIEYSADVLWGMQLLAMNAKIFDSDKNLQTKRNFVREQKNAVPRLIELVGLKNRYGRASTRYFFRYFAPFDLFVPIMKEEKEAESEIQEIYDVFSKDEKIVRK